MSSEPGVSSYDKIFAHLAACPEFQDCRIRFKERLAAVGPVEYSFRVASRYSTGEDVVEQGLTARYGTKEINLGVHPDDGAVQLWPNPDGLLTDDEAKAVVEANFGTKRCKTYFCKVERVLGGDDRKNGKKTDGFAVWARKKLRDEDSDAWEDAKKRVLESARVAMASPEYAAAKRRCYEEHVIGQIRTTVLKYFDKVGPEVIKEALDQVIAHSIMDS